MRVVIYKRVSTDEQVSGYSLDEQEAQCRTFAANKNQGWNVTCVYADEGYSGRNKDRPALQQMLRDARARMFDVVLAYKLDRLGRNTRLLLEIAEELEKLRIQLIFVTESMAFAGAAGRFTLSTIAGAAQFFSDIQSERISDSLAQKVTQGGWVGHVPLGYDRRKEDGLLIPNADAPAVVYAHEQYASDTLSMQTLATHLNHNGFRSINARKQRVPFTWMSLRSILGNRVYLGYVKYHDKEYLGKHEPLITLDLWEAVVQTLKRRGQWRGSPVHQRQNLLAGMVYCGACGGKIHVHSARINPATGDYYRYYHCFASMQDACDERAAPAESAERQLLQWIARLSLPDDLRQEIVQEIRQQLRGRTAFQSSVNEDKLNRRLEKYKHLFLEDHITYEEYAAERAAIMQNLQQLQTASQVQADQVMREQRAIAVLDRLGPQIVKATRNEARPILNSLFEKIWIQDRRIVAVTARGEMFDVLKTLENWSQRFLTQL